MSFSFRRLIFKIVVDGPNAPHDDGHSLTLRHNTHDGCGGVFVLLWLCGWTFGIITMARQEAGRIDHRGMLAFGLMIAIELAALAFVLRSFCGRFELRIDGSELRRTFKVIIPIRSHSIRTSLIRQITVKEVSTKGRSKVPLLTTSGNGEQIDFGQGESAAVLATWARLLRAKFESLTGRTLPDEPDLERITADADARMSQVRSDALAFVGATSEDELRDDPVRRKAAVQHMIDAGIQQSINEHQPSKDAGPIQRAAKGVVSYIALVVWIFAGVVFIASTTVATVQMVVQRHWLEILILLPFWGISLGFAFFLKVTATHYIESGVKLIRKIFNRSR